jgi:alpha-tubulin suppressor-like RCC1 family protein
MTSAGGVLCWGNNNFGQLGNNSNNSSLVPVAVTGLGSASVVKITAGSGHYCALTFAGGVLCWGNNGNGQLGNNSSTASSVPVAVAGLSSGVLAIAAGGLHTCAVTASGGVVCWGNNTNGELGDNSYFGSNVPIAVSGLSSGVATIAAGGEGTCALTTAGGVLCWGAGNVGMLGNNSTTSSLVPVPVSGLGSGVAAISAGAEHNCALTTAGALQCWGAGGFGQLGSGPTMVQSDVPVNVLQP